MSSETTTVDNIPASPDPLQTLAKLGNFTQIPTVQDIELMLVDTGLSRYEELHLKNVLGLALVDPDILKGIMRIRMACNLGIPLTQADADLMYATEMVNFPMTGLNLNGLTLPGLWLVKDKLGGNLSMHATTIKGPIQLEGLIVNGNIGMSYANLHGEVDFSNTTIDEGVDISNATHHNRVSFNNATIKGSFKYDNAKFAGEADFKGLKSGSWVSGVDAEFQKGYKGKLPT